MIIDRSHIVDQLVRFSQKDHGVIIGKPGIGKSYTIAELSQRLGDLDIPVFVLRIDMLPDGSDESLQAEMDSNENWVSFLDKIKLPNEDLKAVLIFDAFDAARDEELRKQYISQIRKAISGLKKWNVVVSVRTYDATKSPQLLRLFRTTSENSKIACRHFEIADLNKQELNSAFDGNPALGKMYNLAGDEFKSILKIPFFLRLLEIILDGIEDADFEKIKLIKSETELLDKFWEKKISNTENPYNKETLLKQLSDHLLLNKTLSYLKDEFIKDNDTFKELCSDDLISEVGVGERYVAFSHNILFDYIVGRLTIPAEPIKLIEFISQDKSRPFFLRPSLIFHFTRLWYNHREVFWGNYKHLENEFDAHVVLFKRLLPTSVIANEFETVNDLELIVSKVDATQQLLQSIRFLCGRALGIRDLELLYELSDKLNVRFLWDFAFVFEKIIKSGDFDQELYGDKCGTIARRFLEFIFVTRNKNPEGRYSLDRLGSTRGIEFVSRTFNSDVDESKRLLKQVLELLKEPDFEIWYFSSLSDNIEHFTRYDPEFVAEIYYTIFGHKEESDEKTNMGGSVTLNLISNRKQDFEMCYFRLVEFFPNFLRIAPEIAIRTGLEIINNYVIKDKLHFASDKVSFQKVQINDIEGKYLSDLSSMWHESLASHKPAQLEEKIILYLKELITAGDVEKINNMLPIYFSHAVVGFLWKKLIELGNEYPEIFKEYLYQLTLNQIILDSNDTTYEIGVSLQKIYTELNSGQREQVEESILKLSENEHDKDKRNVEHKVNRLLNCIPKELLSKEESRSIVYESEAIKNESSFKSSWSCEPYTTDKWLEEQDVDLNEEDNKEVYELLSQLESFNHQRMNDIPNRMQFTELLPIAKKLFQLIRDDGKYKDELRYATLKEVSKYYSIITRNASQIESEDYQIAKDAIVYSMNYISKYDESFDETSSPSTGYSPTPRTEASSALAGLLRFKNDDEVFQLIQKNIVDSNPIVRFNILRNISQVWIERPTDFWELVFERLVNEPDSFTMATILNNVYRSDLIEKNEEQVIQAVQIASNRINEYGAKDSFFEAYAGILLFLLDNRKNEIAKGIIYDNIEKTDFIQTLIFRLFDFIDPKYPDNDYTIEGTRKELIQLFHDITARNLDLLKNVDYSKLNKESPDKKRLQLIDFIVQRIYFALDINERIRKKHELHTNEKGKRAFYDKVKPLLSNIVDSSKEIGKGIIVAHTAHYLIMILNGIIKFYPEEAASILEMTTQITELSYRTGYTFDSSAIKEVVSLTESLFADHKQLLQNNDSLNHLVSILNIYVESGWTEALELLWKLDEVFK